jgi:hypothetical protein
MFRKCKNKGLRLCMSVGFCFDENLILHTNPREYFRKMIILSCVETRD